MTKKGCHGEALEPCGVAYPLCIALMHWRCACAHASRASAWHPSTCRRVTPGKFILWVK